MKAIIAFMNVYMYGYIYTENQVMHVDNFDMYYINNWQANDILCFYLCVVGWIAVYRLV